jgi:hypothetical protein
MSDKPITGETVVTPSSPSVPAASVPATAAPAPAVPRPFSGGLEPGTLRGGRGELVAKEDPYAKLIQDVNAMDGKQMRKWLHIPGNQEKLQEALRKKGEKQ